MYLLNSISLYVNKVYACSNNPTLSLGIIARQKWVTFVCYIYRPPGELYKKGVYIIMRKNHALLILEFRPIILLGFVIPKINVIEFPVFTIAVSINTCCNQNKLFQKYSTLIMKKETEDNFALLL